RHRARDWTRCRRRGCECPAALPARPVRPHPDRPLPPDGRARQAGAHVARTPRQRRAPGRRGGCVPASEPPRRTARRSRRGKGCRTCSIQFCRTLGWLPYYRKAIRPASTRAGRAPQRTPGSLLKPAISRISPPARTSRRRILLLPRPRRGVPTSARRASRQRPRTPSWVALGAWLALAAALPGRAADAPAGEFRDCLAQVRPEALGKGVSPQTFDAAVGSLEPDPSVLEAMSYQPEFRVPIWDYLAGLVDAQRIADGRAMLEQWAP